MNQTELLKHQAAQDQAQIHNLQLRLANAVARAERAEEELKALAEQEPVMCNAALGNGDGTYSSHFLKWPLKAYEKPIHPVSEFFYARPIPAHPSQPGAVGDATSPIPPEWIAAVTAARDQFLKYAELHLAKGTQDGNEKARANLNRARHGATGATMNETVQPAVAGPVEPTVRPVADKLRSAAARTTRTNAEVALLCEYAMQAAAQLDRMADALGRLRKWGDMGDGYSASLMMDVRDWIDGGMVGELPPMPEWAAERMRALERMKRRA